MMMKEVFYEFMSGRLGAVAVRTLAVVFTDKFVYFVMTPSLWIYF